MRKVAMSSNIPQTEIENCEDQHPNNINDRTMQLLNIYIEKSGMEWGEKLRDSLIQHSRRKAQQVEKMLLQDNGNNLHV